MDQSEEPKRRDANENPWYCLATLYGEQPKNDYNRELADRNRIAWNRWMTSHLSGEERNALLKRGVAKNDLKPLSDEEEANFIRDFALRTKRLSDRPPQPNDGIDFRDTYFHEPVVFSGFVFPVSIDCTSATFSGVASFRSAMFSENASFESATFSGVTSFESATFYGVASFVSVTFFGDARFALATFSDDVYFSSARFSGDASFGAATFSGYVLFSSASFSGVASFRSATFSKGAIFAPTTFSSETIFVSATFSLRASFLNAKFTAFTDFSHAKFETQVPDFRGATLHEATEWHGATWPPAVRDKDAAQAQVYAHERLKLEMERLKKHEDEQFFFRKELRARRGTMKPWSGAWVLNWVYEVASDYGHSMSRPLCGLIGLLVLGVSIFETYPVGTRMDFWHAAGLSAAYIFSFLPMSRDIVADARGLGLSGAGQAVGGIESVLGLVLFFLLGLALRNRFRMR